MKSEQQGTLRRILFTNATIIISKDVSRNEKPMPVSYCAGSNEGRGWPRETHHTAFFPGWFSTEFPTTSETRSYVKHQFVGKKSDNHFVLLTRPHMHFTWCSHVFLTHSLACLIEWRQNSVYTFWGPFCISFLFIFFVFSSLILSQCSCLFSYFIFLILWNITDGLPIKISATSCLSPIQYASDSKIISYFV